MVWVAACAPGTRLHRRFPARANWWSERGWDVYLDDEEALALVVDYVNERQ